MRNNDNQSIWFQIPVILIKIVRILTKKPSGQPKTVVFKLFGTSINVSTYPELGMVRLEVITLPALVLEGKKSKSKDEYQPRLDLGRDK
jgi:hypothetical protein